MKHSLYFLGIVGLVSTFWACTAEDAAPPVPVVRDQVSEISSSSLAAELPASSAIEQKSDTNEQVDNKTSDDQKTQNNNQDNKDQEKKNPVNKDSTVVIDTTNNGSEFDDPYFSSGIFCWTEGCELWITSSSKSSSSSKAASSASTPKSSSSKAKSSSSKAKSSSSKYDGTTISDPRDENVKYRVRSIAGNTWMDDNINFEVEGDSKCYNDEESNCEKYGRLYNAEGAKKACPDGWRLPNREDFEKAMSTEGFIWLYTGRIKIEGDNTSYNHDFLNEMGFLWVDGEKQSGDKNYDKYPEGALIVVQKSPDYDASAKDREFFQVDEKDKFFSVRCIVGKAE